MPTYEYECTECAHQWEAEQRIVDAPLDTCPACNRKTAKRLVSAANFILKGGGWYADLYSSPKTQHAESGNHESHASNKETKTENTDAKPVETNSTAAAETTTTPTDASTPT